MTRSAARPSSGMGAPLGGGAALLRRVLRRALRDHRPRLRDEDPAAKLAVDDDVTPDLEQVGNRSRVADGNGGRRLGADVFQPEPKTAGVRVAGDRSHDDTGELDGSRVARRADWVPRTGSLRPRWTCTAGTRRAPPRPRARSRAAPDSRSEPREESSRVRSRPAGIRLPRADSARDPAQAGSRATTRRPGIR